jgi:glycosyltransferase involved in cell wall biosynthesis
MRLIIAAKVDAADKDYYEHAIAPMIRASTLVEYIGEVNEQEKDDLLGHAYAYLFPIDWPEPFGLTMAEAMATGTPVIAYRAGSVPEVVIHGATGYVCDTFIDMIAAVPQIRCIKRTACREHVERNFSVATMADGYESVYAGLLTR